MPRIARIWYSRFTSLTWNPPATDWTVITLISTFGQLYTKWIIRSISSINPHSSRSLSYKIFSISSAWLTILGISLGSVIAIYPLCRILTLSANRRILSSWLRVTITIGISLRLILTIPYCRLRKRLRSALSLQLNLRRYRLVDLDFRKIKIQVRHQFSQRVRKSHNQPAPLTTILSQWRNQYFLQKWPKRAVMLNHKWPLKGKIIKCSHK